MADVTPEKSIRLQRREARMKMVRDAQQPRKVRVSPANEDHRGLLTHPNAGAFRSSGSIEWPLDSFTKRRIRDGDVTVEQRAQNQPETQSQTQDQNVAGQAQESTGVQAEPIAQGGSGSGQVAAQGPEGSPPSDEAKPI